MNGRVLAIGDIHGCFQDLKNLVENKIQLTRNDRLIFLGDYIDRGLQSKEVVDYIIALQKNYKVITLLGNHETMLLSALKNEDHWPVWLMNGGAKTLSSFGISTINGLSNRYVSFFKKLIPFYRIGDYLFVHAGFNDYTENPFDDIYDMLWRCREKYTHPALKDKVIVHGHCLVKPGKCLDAVRDNHRVIGIDTGCVYKKSKDYGQLTAYSVYEGQLYFVKQ